MAVFALPASIRLLHPAMQSEFGNTRFGTSVTADLLIFLADGLYFTNTSLLARFERRPMHSPERRKHPRFTVSLPVEVHTEGGEAAFRCITSDLSLGGCYIETTCPFPVGTTLDLKLRIEDLLHIQARVITAYPQVGNGMQFIKILPEDHDLLNAFLDAIARREELADAENK